MSIFAIADLHLSGIEGEAKSMAVFDDRWLQSKHKLERNWRAIVNESDHIVIPGDFSWAMSLDEAEDDFAFIDSLPGTKYIGKGNHDFWWSSAKKMDNFFSNKGFNSLKILYNNSFVVDNTAICGTRGWFLDQAQQKTAGTTDWEKISRRETIRLENSLSSVDPSADVEKVVFLHFPPLWKGFLCREIIDIMQSHKVRRCYYGHIHGFYDSSADFEFEGILFRMISADHLDFSPLPV